MHSNEAWMHHYSTMYIDMWVAHQGLLLHKESILLNTSVHSHVFAGSSSKRNDIISAQFIPCNVTWFIPFDFIVLNVV